MFTLLTVLAYIAAVAVPGILTAFLLALFYKWAVRLFGEKRFVETDSIDTLANFINPTLLSLFLLIILPIFEQAREKARHHHTAVNVIHWWWIIPAISAGFALWGVLELWLRGIGHRKQEFNVTEGAIIRNRDRTELHPLFVLQKRDSINTALACWYTYYGLTLHDAQGSLAQNDYLTEGEIEKTLDDVLTVAAPKGCRAMEDLWLIWNEDGKRLHEVRLGQQWVPLICGLLRDPMSAKRQWWEQWLRPTFPKDGQVDINSADFAQHLFYLHETYPDVFAADTELEKHYQSAQLLLQKVESGVQLIARERYDTFCDEWRGGEIRMGHWEDGIMVYEVERQ